MSAPDPTALSPERWKRLSIEQRAAVSDAARRRAAALRAEAVHAAATALLGALRRAWRSARRAASPVAGRPVARA